MSCCLNRPKAVQEEGSKQAEEKSYCYHICGFRKGANLRKLQRYYFFYLSSKQVMSCGLLIWCGQGLLQESGGKQAQKPRKEAADKPTTLPALCCGLLGSCSILPELPCLWVLMKINCFSRVPAVLLVLKMNSVFIEKNQSMLELLQQLIVEKSFQLTYVTIVSLYSQTPN